MAYQLLLCGIIIMIKDLLRLDKLWKLENPTKDEIKEVFEICSKYLHIDSFEVLNTT